jgi:hypothetical protein
VSWIEGESEHEPHIEVGMDSCLVRCSCGWATAPNLARSCSTKRVALDEWYRHYVAALL